ncbi:MAG: methyltransferase domain-containing protein, partial [Acidimicrobiales bacterium]|nr:methyltransferase domain-containing protein [Acidimicrobiales bacterium]
MGENQSLGKSHIRQVLESRGIRPSKSLGQNFLVDPNVARRIVKISGVSDGDLVLEIGAGLGSLTVELASVGAKVIAVEFDRNLIEVLREHTFGQDVQIIHGDAMKMDFKELLKEFDPASNSWTMVSNLPYNIATPLVINLLIQVPEIKKMVIM